MCDIKDRLDKLRNTAFVQNKLLARNGICKFGMLCAKDGEVLGYCYQKEGRFVFVDHSGEEIKRPLYTFSNDDISFVDGFAFNMKRINAEYKQSTMLLKYNENEQLYSMCIPSSEAFSSIYNRNDGEYYLVCKDGKGVSLNMYCPGLPYFEFIDMRRYIHLTFHNTDPDACVHDNREYADSLSDVICIKDTSEVFTDSEIINYKGYKVVCSQDPKCTIVFTDGMDEIFRREECAVFCKFGQFAYVIFEKAQLAYNIDEGKEIQLEGLEEYDNYDVGLGYLVRYQAISHKGEDVLCEDEYEGQYWKRIPKHDLTTAYIYNNNLELVNKLKVAGIFNDFVYREGKKMLWFSVEGESPRELYYDVHCENNLMYDSNIRHYYTSPDIIEEN